jgi:hypothetical protein
MTSGRQQLAEADPAVETGSTADDTIADCGIDIAELFQTEPPKAFGPDLSGGHRASDRRPMAPTASTKRLLDQLVKAAMAKPNGRLEMPGGCQDQTGADLEGKSYRVMVMADGFA